MHNSGSLRPLIRALGSVLRRAQDPVLWFPFVALGIVKLAFLSSLGRFDLLPVPLVAALLSFVPQAEYALHYPAIVFRLPEMARSLDLVLFVSVGALVQGWAITRMAQAWTGRSLSLFPDLKSALARGLALVLFSALIAVTPLLVREAIEFLGEKSIAPWMALAMGLLTHMLLFAAPAFRLIDDASFVQSIQRSVMLLTRMPLAVPMAIVFLGAIHLPGLVLQNPAIMAGVHRDPDWIFVAIAAQIPADVCGAFLAAGLAARLCLTPSSKGRSA